MVLKAKICIGKGTAKLEFPEGVGRGTNQYKLPMAGEVWQFSGTTHHIKS